MPIAVFGGVSDFAASVKQVVLPVIPLLDESEVSYVKP